MKKLVLALALFSFGCASVHHGEMSNSLDRGGDDLRISADPIQDYSDESDIYLDFSIENQSSRWIKIDQVTIDFPTQDHIVHNVIVGNDLKVWGESMNNKLRLKQQNDHIESIAIALGGLAVAILGMKNGDSGMTAIGAGALSVSAGMDEGHRLHNERLAAETSSYSVPESYLLAPFTVPSHGYLRRWLLVNIPEKIIAKKALLTLKTIEGETLRYEVPIVFPWARKSAKN